MISAHGGAPPPHTQKSSLAVGPDAHPKQSVASGFCLRPGLDPDAVIVAASVAAHGWPVLALRPRSKHPAHNGSTLPNHREHWLTTPQSVVTAHDETGHQEHNTVGCQFAAITGQGSTDLDGLALVALDLDGDMTALDDLLSEAGPEAQAWAATTLKVQRCDNRAHLWGTAPAEAVARTGDLAPGLEWRGNGGYVLLPGARHPEGDIYRITGGERLHTEGDMPTGTVYAGVLDEGDSLAVEWVKPLPMPASLIAAVHRRLDRADDRHDLDREPAHGHVEPVPVGVAERRLAGIVRAVENAEPGEGNKVLNWAAGIAGALWVVSGGDLDEAELRDGLLAAFLARPIPDRETESSRKREGLDTIASGWRWGVANPAQALKETPPTVAHSEITAERNNTMQATDETVTAASPENDNDSNAARRVILTPAAAIQPQRVRWLWDGRIALGTLALLAGREGQGKSSVGYWLASQITRGLLPGECFGEPASVLVGATEDSWAHVIVPRLMAADADLSRVYRVEVDTDGLLGELSLPNDADALTEAVRQTGARLLILDPLMSRLSNRLDTHKDAEVRQALEPVVRAADELGIAMLGLMHHNKSGSTDPLQLVMGSKAFTALARSVHTVVPDPDDEAVKLFGTPKNNLGRTDLPTLTYRIEEVLLGEDRGIDPAEGVIAVGAVRWGEDRDESIGEAMRAEAAKGRGKGKAAKATDAAQVWLWDHLLTNGGAAVASEAQAAGEEDGHAERTMQRAAKQMKEQGHLVIAREGFPARSMWKLARVQNGENDDRDNLARLDGGEK